MVNGGICPERNFSSCLIFIKTEDGFVIVIVISTKYCPSPIPSGGLEIELLLKFSYPEQKTFENMKNFVDSLYDYKCSGVNDEDEDEGAIVIETDQSKPVSHTAAAQLKLVSYLIREKKRGKVTNFRR